MQEAAWHSTFTSLPVQPGRGPKLYDLSVTLLGLFDVSHGHLECPCMADHACSFPRNGPISTLPVNSRAHSEHGEAESADLMQPLPAYLHNLRDFLLRLLGDVSSFQGCALAKRPSNDRLLHLGTAITSDWGYFSM